MKYIYIKLLHSIIVTSAILVALYLNQMYFAIGFAIFAVLLYPFKSDFDSNSNDEQYKKNFADIDAVLKDHEKALVEIINKLKNQ